jgi:hypothetical protein
MLMSNKHIEARANLNGAEIFYQIDGAGEPLLLLHATAVMDLSSLKPRLSFRTTP